MSQEFQGIFPYLVSPIDHNGKVMEEVLVRLVDHLIEAGVHGLTPLGSTGEFYYLTWEQKRRIVEIVVRAANRRVPVVAGVASATTADAIFQAREFAAIGVDGIVGILNVYFPLKQESIFEYYKALANAVDLPVVVYNNPKFSGFEISLETLEWLAEIPNIQYYKDASINTGRLMTVINRVGTDLRIFSASSHIPVFVMQMGGVGWMSGPACLIPGESVRLFDLCRSGKWDEAIVLQKKLWEINTRFQKYNLAACVKAGLKLQGFDVGDPIRPNPALDERAICDIQNMLEQVKYM